MELWLANLNSLVELMIFAIASTIGLYTFKIHKVTGARKAKLLGISFILIGLSFLTKVVLNIVMNNIAIQGHIFVPILTLMYAAFLLFGYTVLDKLFLDIRAYRVFGLQITLFVASLFLVYLNGLVFLDLMSFLLLAFPVIHFFDNVREKYSRNSLMIFLGFFALMISHASFLLTFINKSLFFADNLIRLVAFVVLFSHYVMVRK